MTDNAPKIRLNLDEPLDVRVTAEDIAAGVRGCDLRCPIALALARHGLTTRSSVWIAGGLAEYCDVVKPWQQDFDAGHPVAPFSFRIIALEAEETP